MEYYSSIKKNKALTHATMWMDFENISKRSQNKSTHLYEIFTIDKSLEKESRLVVARG